jgi:hypothetical protein
MAIRRLIGLAARQFVNFCEIDELQFQAQNRLALEFLTSGVYDAALIFACPGPKRASPSITRLLVLSLFGQVVPR